MGGHRNPTEKEEEDKDSPLERPTTGSGRQQLIGGVEGILHR